MVRQTNHRINELQYLYRVFSCARTFWPALAHTEKHNTGPKQPELDQFFRYRVTTHSDRPCSGAILPAPCPRHRPEEVTIDAKTGLAVPHPIVSRRLLPSPTIWPALLRRWLLLLLLL